MNDDWQLRGQRLAAVTSFDEATLVNCRATAREAAAGQLLDASASYVATGFVLTYEHRRSKHTYYRLLIEGHEVDLDSYALFAAIELGGAYRVYFTLQGRTLQFIEAVVASEVRDAVADAVALAGLNPADAAARSDERVEALVRGALLDAFAASFDFVRQDLTANRRGELTPREVKKLRSAALGCFTGAGVLLLGGGFFATRAMTDSLVASSIIGLVTLLFSFGCVLLGVRRRRDASAGRVMSAVARLVFEGKSGEERNLVAQAGPTFSVPLRAFSVRGHQPLRLVALDYCVYYAPSEAEVMSLEPLDLSRVLAPPDA